MSSTTTAAMREGNFSRVRSTESTRARTLPTHHLRHQSGTAGGRAGSRVSRPFSTGKGNWMCSNASARSMSAQTAEKPTKSGEFAGHAEPPSRVLAGVRSPPEPAGTRRTLVKSPLGLHPPIALSNNTMMMLTASVMVIAVARSASSQTCLRRRAGCKLSEPVAVRAERATEVAHVVRRWRWHDGSTVDTTKINLYAQPTIQRPCHSFATRSACSCGWTANPNASTDTSALGATCLTHSCR